ncbi:22029_t:CDS:2, partial [Gigaspora rosea]
MDTLGEDYEEIQNGEESNPLTKKELIGWYFHNFAIGGYDTAAISVFIPVVLEGLSSQAGYERDQVTPCNTTVTDYECVTRFGASFVDTESYSLYLISVSVLFQAILFISCGSLADHGTYIPIFSRCHPDVIKAKTSNASISEVKTLMDKIATKLSSYSMAADLISGLVVIIAGLGLVLVTTEGPAGFQFALAFCDGMNTLVTVCVLFGKKELGMTNIELSLFAIIVPICAVIGFWLPFGLVNKWEVWMYLVLFGLLVGSIQSYCQACFAIIIPEGHENEFFSLFQITSKGSSAIGPLVSGAITNYTHNIRLCYWFLFALIASPILILTTLDIEKGKSDAKIFVEKEEETKNKDIR